MGLGGFPDVSLKEARELATDYRKMARQGIDPIKTRSQQRREALRPRSNLADIAEAAYEAKKAELKNAMALTHVGSVRCNCTFFQS